MARRKKEVVEDDPIDAILNRYSGVLLRATDYTAPWAVKRLPTGLARMDIALNGGFPAGTMAMLVGPPGIGKNTVANYTIARQQQIMGDDLRVGVVITEGSYDKTQARLNNVQIALSDAEIRAYIKARRKAGYKVTPGEIRDLRRQVGKFYFAQHETADVLFEIALDMVRSRKFDVVLIDSFGVILSTTDEDKTLSDNDRMAGPALLNTKFATRMFSALGPDEHGNPNMTWVCGINQVRDNINRANPNSPKTSESGGYALKHARSVCIEMGKKAMTTDKKASAATGGRVRASKTVLWQITKQKAGGHEGHSATFEYRFATGADFALDLLEAGIEHGVIEKVANSYFYEDEIIGGKKGLGKDKTADVIRADPGMFDLLYEEVIREAGICCLYGNEGDIYDSDIDEIMAAVEAEERAEARDADMLQQLADARAALDEGDRVFLLEWLKLHEVDVGKRPRIDKLKALGEELLVRLLDQHDEGSGDEEEE